MTSALARITKPKTKGTSLARADRNLSILSRVTQSDEDLVSIIEGVTSQISGLMSLKNVALMLDVNSKDLFTWLRDTKGWIGYGVVLEQAIVDWNKGNLTAGGASTLTLKTENTLIYAVGGGLYLNTLSALYDDFITLVRGLGLRPGYNLKVKDSVPDYTKSQIDGLRSMGYVVTKQR